MTHKSFAWSTTRRLVSVGGSPTNDDDVVISDVNHFSIVIDHRLNYCAITWSAKLQ